MPNPKHRSAETIARRVGVVLALAGWLAIALATLTPTRGADTTADAACVACDLGWGADLLANVLLFIPLGAGLALAGVRARRALVAVAVTTITVELLQVAFVAGRDASLRDLATNFAGGAVGWFLLRRRTWFLDARAARAAALAATWAVAWVGGTAISGWAFTPSLPASLWWAHWGTESRVGDGVAPVVLDARVGDALLAPGALREWPTLRARLLDGAPLEARVVLAPAATAADAEIVTVDDADTEQELLSFRRRGDGVAFYFRTRGAALRLRSPAIATDDFLSSAGADTVRLAGVFSRGRLHVEAERSGGARVTRSIAVTPNWGWSFFVPSGLALGPATRWLTALWVAALVLPIGFWAVRSYGQSATAMPRAVALAAVVAVPAALVAIPALFALPPVHWSEWAAWVLGTTAGASVGLLVGGGDDAGRAQAAASTTATAAPRSAGDRTRSAAATLTAAAARLLPDAAAWRAAAANSSNAGALE